MHRMRREGAGARRRGGNSSLAPGERGRRLMASRRLTGMLREVAARGGRLGCWDRIRHFCWAGLYRRRRYVSDQVSNIRKKEEEEKNRYSADMYWRRIRRVSVSDTYLICDTRSERCIHVT